MPRKQRTHLEPPRLATEKPMPSESTPRHLTKQEFGRRIYSLMLKKGMRQSDLARASELPRDSISVYIRGRSLPTPLSLQKLASALDVKPEDLLPNHIEAAIDADAPELDLKISSSAPTKAWLRLNRLMSASTALKIVELLQHEDAAEGK